MNATELFRAGRLREAVEAQSRAVKEAPADPNRRLFLVELLAFDGNLDRAGKQIDALVYGDPGRDLVVAVYRLVLQAELARRDFFRGGPAPSFLAAPPDHVRLRLEAVPLLTAGRTADAAALLELAEAATPETPGEIDGLSFPGLRDTDDLFGPVLEVLAQGQYSWVPLEHVAEIVLSPPQAPRDLLWRRARLTTTDGTAGEVFLPVLYPGSQDSSDERVRLGRVTDWSPGPAPVRAVGARVFQAGGQDVCLLDWRHLRLATQPAAPPEPAAPAAPAEPTAPPAGSA